MNLNVLLEKTLNKLQINLNVFFNEFFKGKLTYFNRKNLTPHLNKLKSECTSLITTNHGNNQKDGGNEKNLTGN